ncbi:MAG: histidine kinase [Cytophagales bacterium CG18_big_fil_WC_8_21_14_2_50_42_9]|nr:MAG: histidine kinase [Cytophagales bacterium CG18_big_fil_WC_8_21_14_2_50_42_9]
MNGAQIDFQQLRIKHILYKSKVRSVLYGGVYDENFFSASGPVGTWFTTVGMPRYGLQAEMRELAIINQDLNATAINLFHLYKSGRIDQAHDGMKNVETKSDRFINILSQLERKLKDSPLSIYSS